ncbi:MAG: type II toxin-antitoxin system RelE/ParE family toxin [Thermoprotei archaeon]|nr:MAG: type II toxin-antitoxin system RelE/ParE family toxin [Thermoprotei archaeon]
MGFYKILFKRSVERDLRKINPSDLPWVLEAIEKLAFNPFPRGCIKLKGAENIFRIRVGAYRIVYSVDKQNKIITVYYVHHRRSVYRSFK